MNGLWWFKNLLGFFPNVLILFDERVSGEGKGAPSAPGTIRNMFVRGQVFIQCSQPWK